MENHLEKLCMDMGIKLLFVNNKEVILSCDIKNNIPIIKAHKIFEKCSKEVAVAVLKYYTDGSREAEYEKVIKSFIDENFIVESYKIKNPKSMLKSLIIDFMPLDPNIISETGLLCEYSIISLLVIDKLGIQKYINLESSIKPHRNDILEMELVVSPLLNSSENCEKLEPKFKTIPLISTEYTNIRKKDSIIHGAVKYPSGNFVQDAVVKLFVKDSFNPYNLIPIILGFTDDCGQFLFEVDSYKDYVIKVFTKDKIK